MKRTAVFFHIALMEGHEAVYREIKNSLDRFLLGSASVYVENRSSPDLYEFPTLDLISGFARRNPDFNCLYVHTKGVSRPGNTCVADWRRSMTYFMVEKHEECCRKLEEYDTVGCNYTVYHSVPHWQGNFWWARSEHLSRLKYARHIKYNTDINDVWDLRHKCEAWVMSLRNPSWYEMYNHHLDPYTQNNPESGYRS
jgi:hypothetical protein